MKAVAKILNETPVKIERVAFGVFDGKRREVGAIIRTFEMDLVADDAGNVRDLEYYGGKLGHRFAANVQSARQGKDYGASQNSKYFGTEAERAQYIAKRLADSKKAAAKKAA